MSDDTVTVHGDMDDRAAPPIPSLSFDEIQIQCKTEPDTELVNPTDEALLAFNESSLHIPVYIPTIKSPIVLLERCDKIWNTLQLIKTVQIEKPITPTDDCDKTEKENEEEAQCLDEIEHSISYSVKNQPRMKSDNAVPFKFSVQKTRKLYPCTTCGKQYLERRSLRKHSERVHGVVLPLLIRARWKRTLNKKNFNKARKVSSTSKENNNSEKLYNKDSSEKIAGKTKLNNVETTSSPDVSTQFVKCTLCQQKVTSLRKHLINYHKIGGSSSMVEQLESSLLNETKTPSEDKKTAMTNVSRQDGFRIMDNEGDARGTTSQVQGKRKYTLSYYGNARKKHKLNNKRIMFVQNPPAATQKQISNVYSYKCDICLGMYKSTHSLYKHRRNHIIRGETKENFHKFKCRYFNSPFNKKFRSQSSMKSANTGTNSDRANEKNTLRLNRAKRNTLFDENSSISHRVTRYSERLKNDETTCICGRSFRNPHTLFIHKKNCELCQNDDTMQSTISSDRDSGTGINITIKKRNDSYEIVGKDDEDNPQKSETHLEEATSSISRVSNYTKDFTKASNKQQVSDTSESSKYSKHHSILKLQDTDEDVIIDIEDDVQITLDENNTMKRLITQEDGKRDLLKQQNEEVKDGKTDKDFDEVTTLKQMCQDVLDVEIRKSRNIEDENKKCNQIKDQEMYKENNQVKNQKIRQENKRELRSANKRYLYSKVELDHSYDGTKVCMVDLNPLICGYCKEEFNTVKSYDNHQCTVTKGKSFDEFSLQLLCFYCKEVLNNYSEFDKHVRVKHFDRSYHCYQCPERFTSDKARLNHFHLEHDLICRFCNKKISISVKALHEGYHLGFGYPCHKCKKAYINNKNLSYHRYTIHFNGADNLVTCAVCLKSVKLKTYRGHMKVHKQHNICNFCGKVFSDRAGLEYHIMMHHSTHSKLKCNICGTRFYTKKQLERHEQIDGCSRE